MSKYCIIGFGISGQILVLELLKNNVSPSDIIICDETFLGGDLMISYSSVLSNTPWWKTKKALEQYTTILPEFPVDQCTPVSEIAKACLKTALNMARDVEKITTSVLSLEYTDIWTITHLFGTFQATTVFLTTGGKQRVLDLSVPQIPLSIALEKNRLKDYVTAKDIIILFGTSHSGTIVIDNLNSLDIETYAVYKGEKFYFEPESYGGLKEQSAIIAKSIMNGDYTKITLIPWSDPLIIYKYLKKATKAIIAAGFEPRILDKKFKEYYPQTGIIQGEKNLYGFGMAYPGLTEIDGKKYKDISVLSFQEQIQKCLPQIIKSNNN
jgi:hypothetical protein